MNFTLLAMVLLAALAFRVVMHFVDKNRIKDEVEGKLGRIVSIHWNPFGRGWFFEKGERHYDVTYVDRSGQTVSTGCKTSLFTGVYWAEGPKLTEPPARIVSRHLCSKCGYSLNIDWRACPNCGKATGFA
jgi:uncharacterized OB-fold protein